MATRIVMGDVTGHGLESGVLMLMVQSDGLKMHIVYPQSVLIYYDICKDA